MTTPVTDRLVGRSAPLAEIDEALAAGRSVLVTGARGTGRSAVLAEAARRHTAAGGRVLAAAALPGDARLPGAGLQRLFTPVQHEIASLAPPAAAAFARLLGRDGPDVPAAPPAEAVRALAHRLAADGRWLWCVDDLDRLDDLSRDAILAQHLTPVLAGTTAGTPPGAGPAGFRRVRLAGLSRADAARLVAGLPGSHAHPGTRLVLAQAAGNPLALTELTRHLPPADELAGTTTELPVPARLRRALAPAVDRLDPVRLRAALLAAFAAETPGPAAARALDALVPPGVWDRLAGDGVLRPARGRRFAHPVVRAAVIDRAGHAQRRDARHELAALLPDGDPARAWHTARAEPSADDRVARTLQEAGGELIGRGRLRAGAYALAMAAERSTDPAAAHARRRHAAYAAHLAGEPAWSSRLTAGGTAGAGRAVRTPVELPELAPLLRVAWMRGDEESLGAVRELLRSGRPIATPLLEVWARAIVEDADPAGDIPRLLHRGDRPGRTDPMAPDQRAMVLGTIAMVRHETTPALTQMGRALTLAATGALHHPMALGGLAGAHLDAGDLTAAREHALRALDAVGPGPSGGFAVVLDDIRAGALAVLAAVAELREEPDRDARVREAVEALHPLGQAVHDLRLVRARGLAADIRGQHHLAYHRLRRLYHADGRPVHHRVADLGLADLTRVAVVTGQADKVAPIVTAAEPRIRQLRSARTTAIWHRARALLAGTGPGAETFFRLALADPGTDRWTFERAVTRMDYAEWLRRRHRPAESRPLLEAARDVFAAAGLTAWRDRAEAELAAAAPPPRPGAGKGLRLTAQQRQVVTLAAQGLTNPQIADRLGISARTVGIHLSRAYGILGVSRRAQLPQVLEQSFD